MATNIRSYEEIDKLQQLDGVRISEIERRARPGMYAISGFLGSHELLKDVLKKDWQTVRRLGTTHIELANKINAIWEKCSYGRTKIILHTSTSPKPLLERAPFKLATLIFLVSAIAIVIFNNPLGWFGVCLAVSFALLALSKMQILLVSHSAYRGMQEDIFGDKGWNSEISILNLLNLKQIKIAAGAVDYIKKFGFYEGGGDQNPYRVDPARLTVII